VTTKRVSWENKSKKKLTFFYFIYRTSTLFFIKNIFIELALFFYSDDFQNLGIILDEAKKKMLVGEIKAKGN